MNQTHTKTSGQMQTSQPRSLAIAQRFAGGTNIASGVYGNIITIAVIGAWYADPTSGALETLLSVLATLLVFWVAHGYAHMVGDGFTRSHVIAAFKQDWPIVQSGFLSMGVLGLGALEVIEERHALLLAIGMGGVSLALFCLMMARAMGRNWAYSILLTLIMAALGICVAILEIKLG